MTIESSLLEQAFVKEEAGYGTLATPGATDGFRHQELLLDKKKNREPSPEKRGTPDRQQSLPRITDTTWDLSAAFWEPSGTLGTQSYLSAFLKNGMGTRNINNLATTVQAAPAPTTTGARLTSATGLNVGDCIVFTVASGARREITRIKTIASLDITFDALSVAPDVPGAAVAGVSYQLASLVPTSLSIFKFFTAGGFKQAVKGAIVNRLEIMFDGGKEVGIKLSGPAADLVKTGFSQPGAFTTVGSPASGLVGNLYVDGAAFLVLSASIVIEDNNLLRKGEIGTGGIATGIIHHGDFRNVTVSVSFYLEDTNLLDKADTSTKFVLRCLIGNTNGQMVGAVVPSLELEIPPLPTSGGPLVVTASGVAYATNGNDQVFLAE